MTDVLAPQASALSPLSFQLRRAVGPVVGRPIELTAIEQELAASKTGRLAALTLEGEPGIGKTRLLLAAGESATAQGLTPAAVTTDEEIRGPFLLARAIFGAIHSQVADATADVQEPLRRALDAVAGKDETGLEGLPPDHKVMRVFDLAAVAVRTVASVRPVALLIDDLQWADNDSLRMLRYIVRTSADIPLFLGLALRPEEMATVTGATTLLADMERMGIVRRLKLGRFSQLETTEFLRQVLAGDVNLSSGATMHTQAEGVPFIVEELARTYRDAGMIQEIDGIWALARNAERLVPQAVQTLIQRRAGRLPEQTKVLLAEAAVLGRSFSLKDLRAIKLHLSEGSEDCDPEQLAEALRPASETGLLLELSEADPADYRFTHEQVREFATAGLTPARRRAIHAAVVDVLCGGGEAPAGSLALLAHHALAAGDTERAARFSIDAARQALAAHAPEEVLRVVDLTLPGTSEASERVALLMARDQALDMLRRSSDRLEGLAELAALADALGDSHLELEVMLRRAAALRLSGEEDRAAQLARQVRTLACENRDRRAELAACLELGQDLMGAPLGESFSPTESEVDLDGAYEAFEGAAALAEELGDLAALAAATRELGIIHLGRARTWFVEQVQKGELMPILQRVVRGEDAKAVLAETPVAPLIRQAQSCSERALALFEKLGDRRGVMSSIIAMAYVQFGVDIHFMASAKRIEEIRRLATRMRSFTKESERALTDAQMLYGAHVFARAKVVPDMALSRGEEAFHQARVIGDRSLEFASAGGVALVHLELGEIEQAEIWLDRAAEVAATAPTPLRARRLELWRGMARAAAGSSDEAVKHLDRAVRLATDQGRPAGRCEALAILSLEAGRLGAEHNDEELIAVAERAAREAKELLKVLPGRPLWGAQADAAVAQTALARGDSDRALDAAGAALGALQGAQQEDLHLEILLPAARAICTAGPSEQREMVRGFVQMMLAMVAQRTLDEDVRVRWFRGPLGRELSKLVTPVNEVVPGAEASRQEAAENDRGPRAGDGAIDLPADETAVLWLVIEGRTNEEIARELGVGEDVVVRRLATIHAKLGASSRAEATAFALREKVV